ncbi:MAG: imidazoleglycerol-phosphate dehydratase HisB [Lentisphaeria bacterium]|nr:imidazoleglycerol-phosphate dehydratase HisB [Lentisphaeria bacterium]MDP7740459.1 imidazoleglycerol-phosphate dehydratase HisB [Lentisphaeria bacterium]
MSRKATEKRHTNETKIEISFTVDGEGKADVNTGISFMDHMLTLFARHGFFDLTVKASGDLDIDAHHTMEDLGIVLGTVIRKALGDKKGIRRYGFFILPMDETLARVVLDLSGRACLVYEVEPAARYIKELDVRLFREFFQALTNNLALNLHVDVIRGEDVHHVFEGVFKAFARALDCATSLEPREKGVPTTKGMLD